MRTSLIKQLLLAFAAVLYLHASEAQPLDTIVQRYVQQALQSNLALQQKHISVQQAALALQTAKSYFLPSVDFQAAYQSGRGGRAIDLPIGNLLNPVYNTLNQLTGSNRFPNVDNVETFFFPTNFYDVKVQTNVPIINKNIGFNQQIQQQQLAIKVTDANGYKRLLVQQVKTAYYDYIAATQAVDIYKAALVLAQEGKRTNEKLLNNGKSLPAYLLRAESEIAQVQAQLQTSIKQVENAAMYLNFLLNSPLNTPITIPDNLTVNVLAAQAALQTGNLQQREELKMLQQAVQLQQTVVKMQQSFRTPKLNAFLQLGSQAELNNVSTRSAYYFGGLQLDVPIFNGKRNLHKIQQARYDVQQTETQLKSVTQQLAVTQNIASNDVKVALENYLAAQQQSKAAAAYQRLIEKGYKEGVSTFIETVDARTQLTNAQLLVSVQQFKLLSALAVLEREQATYPLQP
ncbi:MAG: TolC family protein [Chitinophagaceae bacterium]